MTIESLRDVLMGYLKKNRHVGRAKAAVRADVLWQLQSLDPSLDDRKFRIVYAGDPKRKGDFGAGVCSSADGLFIPATTEEVEDFHLFISKQSGPIVAARRRDNVYHWRPELRPGYGKQQVLGI